jgi:hypothetical protein
MEPFLFNLGIRSFDQARPPTVDTFPTAFNTSNRSIWTKAIQQLQPSGNSLQDWAVTLKRYIDLCTHDGIFPFQSSYSESRNDQIFIYLRERRRSFVKFVDKCHLFDDVKIRSTHHKATVTDKGFVLTVYAQARITDPSFIGWLQGLPLPRFSLRQSDGRYIRTIQDGLEIFVYNEAPPLPERWCIGYNISCSMYPDIPNNHLPSKAELERFILDILWMPILRSARPVNTNHRLI